MVLKVREFEFSVVSWRLVAEASVVGNVIGVAIYVFSMCSLILSAWMYQSELCIGVDIICHYQQAVAVLLKVCELEICPCHLAGGSSLCYFNHCV